MPIEIKEHFESLRHKSIDIATRHYLFCQEQIFKEIPEFLKEDEFQIDHACANIFAMRGAVLEEAIKQGYLSFDENNDKQMLSISIKQFPNGRTALQRRIYRWL